MGAGSECDSGIALHFGALLYNKGCINFVQLPSVVQWHCFSRNFKVNAARNTNGGQPVLAANPAHSLL